MNSVFITLMYSSLFVMLIVVFLRVSCALWRFTVCVKASTEASSSRVNSGRRWWSSCSAWRSWSFTAACVESPSGKRTKSCRRYPVPTFSISSRCSLTRLEVSAVLPTEFSRVFLCFISFAHVSRCLQTNGTKGCPKCFKSSIKPGFVWLHSWDGVLDP